MSKLHRIMQIFGVILLPIILTQCGGYAPQTMDDLAMIEQNTLAEMVDITEAQGVADLSKLDAMPQKVGLVSFYVFSPGASTKSDKGPYQAARSDVFEFRWLTDDGASYYGTKLFRAGIDELEKSFEGHDTQLLTSDEFLKTEEQRSYYNNFEPEFGLMIRGAMKFVSALESAATGADLKTSATAPGYRLLAVPADDRKLMTSLKELNDTLELDAMLIIKNTIATEKKDFRLTGVQMRLVGPNPEPQGNAPAISYLPAYTYGMAQVEFEDGYAFDFSEETEEFQENYAGYDQLLKVMADELLSYVEGEM